MKQWITLLLTALLLCTCACAQETLTMDQIRSANDVDALVGSSTSVGMTMVLCSEDGEDIASYYAWLGQGPSGGRMYVTEGDDGSVNITEGGRGYGFDSDRKQLYAVLFMGDQYASIMGSSARIFALDKFAQETVTSVTQEDGKTTVLASCEELGATYALTTVVQSDSLRVLAQRCEVLDDEGVLRTIWHSSYAYGEDYPMDEAFDTLWDAPLHTLTLIDKTEGMNDQKTTFSASRGVAFSVYLPAGYATLYDDEACTKPHEESERYLNEDVVIYIKADEI